MFCVDSGCCQLGELGRTRYFVWIRALADEIHFLQCLWWILGVLPLSGHGYFGWPPNRGELLFGCLWMCFDGNFDLERAQRARLPTIEIMDKMHRKSGGNLKSGIFWNCVVSRGCGVEGRWIWSWWTADSIWKGFCGGSLEKEGFYHCRWIPGGVSKAKDRGLTFERKWLLSRVLGTCYVYNDCGIVMSWFVRRYLVCVARNCVF